MKNNRAKFDKAEYDRSNPVAIKAMTDWLAKKIPDLIVDSSENYGFDIRGTVNGNGSKSFYEVEIKYGWTGEWPESWKEIRIPYRKKRLIDLWQGKFKDELFTFVIFRKDLKKAWHIPADIVMHSKVKEAPNKNVAEGELFFHIDVRDAYQVDMVDDNSNR